MARRAAAAATVALVLAALSAASASAAPSVTVVGRAVPIAGFPHTGNFFGAGAAVHTHITISGSEYGGFPYPLIGIHVFLPKGVKLNPGPFPTCDPVLILQQREPAKCPRGSAAGPPGRGEGVVAFGHSIVPETVEILSFYAPHGGFLFIAEGHSPVSLEVPTSGRLVNLHGAGGFGPEFQGEIPLVETVPGAPDASEETIDITLGSAIRKHGRPIYYGTVPRTCPRGGFKARAEFIFAVNASTTNTETVAVPVSAPCPKR